MIRLEVDVILGVCLILYHPVSVGFKACSVLRRIAMRHVLSSDGLSKHVLSYDGLQ